MNLAIQAYRTALSIQDFYAELKAKHNEGLNEKPLHRMTNHIAIKVMEETGKGTPEYITYISHKRVVSELKELGFTVKSYPNDDTLFTISCN